MIKTKRIEIFINEGDKELRKDYYDRLFQLLYKTQQFANLCASHLYFAENIHQFLYLADEPRNQLKDAAKNENGILAGSHQGITWLLTKTLSDEDRKGITKVLSDVGTRIRSTLINGPEGNREIDQIRRGERSIRNYKNNMPIPVSKQSFNLEKHDNNFNFTFYKIPFRTNLRKDWGTRAILDSVMAGEYKLADSSIQYAKKYDRETGKAKNKWFLLLCVEMPNTRLKPKKGVTVSADLNVFVPIIAKCGKNIREIGSEEEFTYNRIQIQYKLRNLQKALRYANGGNGRKAKLQAIERFKMKEKNYIKTKMHTYSRALVDYAIKMRAESIRLVNQQIKEELTKDEAPLLLRNWSYYGLKQMIEYKAKSVGIEILTN